MLLSENHKLAVLIDGENVSRAHIDTIMREVSQLGDPVVVRIYADWTNPHNSNWKNCLLRYAITPIQQFNYTPGKNSSDFALLIDALEIYQSGKVTGFCIVTSDADFTPLVIRLRQGGMFVVGIGERKSHKSFVTACDHFIYTETMGSGPVPTVAHTIPVEPIAAPRARGGFSRGASRRRGGRAYEAETELPSPVRRSEEPAPAPKPQTQAAAPAVPAAAAPAPVSAPEPVPVPVPSPAPREERPAVRVPFRTAAPAPREETTPRLLQEEPPVREKASPVHLPSNLKPMLVPSLSTPVEVKPPKKEEKPQAKSKPGMVPRLVRPAGVEAPAVSAPAAPAAKAAEAPAAQRVKEEQPSAPVKTEVQPLPTQAPVSMAALVEVITQIIGEDHDAEGWTSLTRVDSQLHKKMPDFHPSQYRYSRLITLVKNADELELDARQTQTGGRAYYLRMKPQVQPVEPAPPPAEAVPAEAKPETSAPEEKAATEEKTVVMPVPLAQETEKAEEASDKPQEAKAEKPAAKPRPRRAPAKKKAEEKPAKAEEAKTEKPAKAEEAKAEKPAAKPRPRRAPAKKKTEEKPAAEAPEKKDE